MILQMFCKIFALFEWRKKRAECIECVVEFQRVNHFTDHLSNNSKIVELWLFSSHFHFTYLFLSQFHAINIANGNWWQPRSLWKHFVLYVLILAFVFILGKYFRNHVPFNSMHSLLSIIFLVWLCIDTEIEIPIQTHEASKSIRETLLAHLHTI